MNRGKEATAELKVLVALNNASVILADIETASDDTKQFYMDVLDLKGNMSSLAELLLDHTSWRLNYKDSVLSVLPISSDSRCIQMFTNATFIDIFTRRILPKFNKSHHLFPVFVSRYAFTEKYLRSRVWEDRNIKHVEREQTVMPKAFVS